MPISPLTSISQPKTPRRLSVPAMPAAAALKRMACVACTKAKRKCTKEAPDCRRCAARGLSCRYPAPRVTPPYDLVFDEDGATSTVATVVAQDDASRRLDRAPAQKKKKRCSPDLARPWFLSPSSWVIEHVSNPPQSLSFSDEALYYFINTMRGWLRQWTSEGHCPLFHSRLYVGADLPDCLQDAYMALVAYQNKTAPTERLVMRMVNRHANKLVQDHPPDDLDVIMLSTTAHLARTQALLVHGIIRLFDGDIQARNEAEAQIDTLALWAGQLWRSAVLDVSSDHSLAAGAAGAGPDQWGAELVGGLFDKQLRTDGDVTGTWRAWVFAESIRRTYLLATLAQAVYRTLKQGWSPCPGGIVFTGGRGLWDAASPRAWLSQAEGNGVFNVRCLEGGKLFEEARPSEVDEFTHVVMIASYGLERFERWTADKET